VLAAAGGLRYRVATGELAGAVRLVSALKLSSEDYTPASWAALAAARGQALAVLADPAATESQTAGAVAALDMALGGLTPAVSTVALETLVSATAGFASDDYTADSWTALDAALDLARSVIAYPEAVSLVDRAIGQLRAAIVGLVPSVSKAPLHTALAVVDAMNLDGADYTAESWRVYREALATARQVLAAGSSQTAVDEALAALRVACSGLVRTAAGTGREPGSTPNTAQTVPPSPTAAPNPAPSVGPAENGPDQSLKSPAVRVKASQTTLRLVKGRSVRLVGYGYTSAGQRLKVTWTSSSPSVAKVSALGKITALRAGKTTVTLRVGGKSAAVKVSVVAAKPAKAAVAKVKANVPKTMAVGQVRYVTGTWTPTSATPVKVAYKSSNKSVAGIDAAGRLTATGKGIAYITVKAGTKLVKYKLVVK
jgi:hypothetical protein